jgi:hypothetical protein
MSLIKHLVFEDPLALWIALGIVAVLAGVLWSRSGSKLALACAIACVAAAVAVAITSYLVETEFEKLQRTLNIMARAAATGDADAFIERISPDYQNGPASRETLAAIVRKGFEQVRAKAESPTIVETDGQATVTQVYNFTAAGSHKPLVAGSDMVKWEGGFARDADGQWRLRWARAIEPLRLTPEEAAQLIRTY